MAQCDLVMVGTGVHVEKCIQFNMANCHVNACNGVLLQNTVQASINNTLIYHVILFPPGHSSCSRVELVCCDPHAAVASRRAAPHTFCCHSPECSAIRVLHLAQGQLHKVKCHFALISTGHDRPDCGLIKEVWKDSANALRSRGFAAIPVMVPAVRRQQWVRHPGGGRQLPQHHCQQHVR